MITTLKIEHLSAGYRGNPVIRDISLQIEKGEFVGIIGPNGSGKTTLLRAVGRNLSAVKGKIFLEGKDIASIGLKQFFQKTAFVAQDTHINFSFTVFELVLMGRIPHLKRLQAETADDFAAAEGALRLTGMLKFKDKYVETLSAGERQLVIISKALAQAPALLFLDEPTAHLDIGHQINIFKLIKNLNQHDNLTVVAVLHDLNLASEHCRRLILMHQGGIFKDGTPDEVLTPENIQKTYNAPVRIEKDSISGKPRVYMDISEMARPARGPALDHCLEPNLSEK